MRHFLKSIISREDPAPQSRSSVGVTFLVLAVLWALWLIVQPPRPSPASSLESAQATLPSPPSAGAKPAAESAPQPPPRLPKPVTRKAVWRLAPGESGLLSYVSEKTRTNGIMLVTLNTDEEGKVILERQEFDVQDSALQAHDLKPHLPEIFEFERSDTLNAAQAQTLLKSLNGHEGVTQQGGGRSWGPFGQPRRGTHTLRYANGEMIRREALMVLLHEADSAGLYQVEVELTTEHGPGSLEPNASAADE